VARYDLAVIGGGVNGCGIARDAAGRGHRVLLLEQGDLAGATSSASTKLVHGGLRYLEHYKFRLVREALTEREVLLRAAPHIVWPLRFVLPHHTGLRPAWMLRLGLFLYDHLGGREILPGTEVIDLTTAETGAPLTPGFRKGFEYSDCWVEDSRLVVLNAVDAAERGADVRVRTKLVSARRAGTVWQLTVQDQHHGGTETLEAGVLVNAAGPWIDRVITGALGSNGPARIRLVKGSHIVVQRLFAHDRAYIFQNADGRIIFAIPYETDFTLIGTTDLDYDGEPGAVSISPTETAYLIAAANEYFRRKLSMADVVWTYSGVRPLYDDGASKAQEATRDYVLTTEGGEGLPFLLNVFGGKITTFRRLAEAALEKLAPHLPRRGGAWTAAAPLPGGDFPVDGFEPLVADVTRAYPFIESRTVRRWVRAYGTRVADMTSGAKSLTDFGLDFGAGLLQREVDYLIEYEFARSAADIVWRRSKLGLRLTVAQIAALDAYVAAHPLVAGPPVPTTDANEVSGP
jgi:glycerol-3-phosphate dehydrogenase